MNRICLIIGCACFEIGAVPQLATVAAGSTVKVGTGDL